MIILLGGKEYAVGLNWFAISSMAEIEQFQQEMEMNYGLVKMSKIEGEPSIVALAPSEYANQISLAGVLSYAYENLIFVCKTTYKDHASRELYYLCTVKKGAVSVDGDMIADLETIHSQYAQNLIDLRSDISEEKIEKIGIDVDDVTFNGMHLADLADVLAPTQRFESQCMIKELRKGGLSKLSLILITILFVIGCYFIYGWFFKAAPPPVIQSTPLQVLKPSQPPPKDPFDVFLDNQSNIYTRSVQLQAFPALLALIKTVPLQLNAWDVKEINIALGKQASLNLSLARTSYATVSDLQALATQGVVKNLNVNVNGQEATAQWNASVEGLPVFDRAILQALKNEKTSEAKYWSFISILQRQNIPVSIKDQPNSASISRKDFKINGNGLWGLEALYNILQSFDTIAITSIHMTLNQGTYDWVIEGVIYG